MKKYLGIDWGEKRIGLSLADDENKIATPFKTVLSIKDLIQVVNLENINFLVIGSPKSLKGGVDLNPKFIKFVEILKSKLNNKNIKICFIDERFTSVIAKSIMNKKINNNIDSLSAMIILQSYLNQK